MMRFFKREGQGLKALREVIETNEQDQAWAEAFHTTARDIQAAYAQAEDALRADPSDAAAARFLQAAADLPRAEHLQRAHGLVAPMLIKRRIERTTAPLIEALKEYEEALGVQIENALKHDSDLADAIGESAGQSPAVAKLNAERNAVRATVEQLARPVEVNQEATRLGSMNRWITQLLAE